MEATQTPVSKPRLRAGWIPRKIATVAVVIVGFGWFYGWASPWAFPANRPAGFGYGLLHGALMPLSLPSLAVGRSVEIYDDNNTGRAYKIGYICGVDICGLVFIGPLFWRPRVTTASSGRSG